MSVRVLDKLQKYKEGLDPKKPIPSKFCNLFLIPSIQKNKFHQNKVDIFSTAYTKKIFLFLAGSLPT